MWCKYNNNKQGVYILNSNSSRYALRIKYGNKYKITLYYVYIIIKMSWIKNKTTLNL